MVVIELALSASEHASLRATGGACGLEDALTQVFVSGLLAGTTKRQVAQFDTDVSEIILYIAISTVKQSCSIYCVYSYIHALYVHSYILFTVLLCCVLQ